MLCLQSTTHFVASFRSAQLLFNLFNSQYENAQMYANVLMDAFMAYKSIYKKLGDQSFSIQNKTLEFEPVDPAQVEANKMPQ